MFSIANPFARKISPAQAPESQTTAPLLAAQSESLTQVQPTNVALNSEELVGASEINLPEFLSQQCLWLTITLGAPVSFGRDKTHGWWLSASHWRLPAGLICVYTDITLLLPDDFPRQPPKFIVTPSDLGGADCLLSKALPINSDADADATAVVVGPQWQICSVPLHPWNSDPADLSAVFANLHLVLKTLGRVSPYIHESTAEKQ